MSKILTICLNPVIQKTLYIDNFKEGAVNRSKKYYTDSSGKGINVTRVLRELNCDVVHLTQLGGININQFLELLENDNLNIEYVNSGASIRNCFTILNIEKNSTTEIVEKGEEINNQCEELFLEKFNSIINNFSWVIISGSKAPGFGNKIIPNMVKTAKELGVKVILDIKGEDLINSLKYNPDIIKHNREEFNETFNTTPINDYTTIIITDGDRDIEIITNKEKISITPPNIEQPVNTTGCGDAFTAGLVSELLNNSDLNKSVEHAINIATLSADIPRPGTIKRYKHGIIIGKFMPLHSGHLSLIEHGLNFCSKITILLVLSKEDPIEPELRYSWLIEHYKNSINIEINIFYRDEINALPQEKRTEAWCNAIESRYRGIDAIISSENYGDVLAETLGIYHIKFDHKRKITPISATEIRENYKKHIHYLPKHVRKFFNK